MGNQPAVVKKAVGSIGSGRILCLLCCRYGVERKFMSACLGGFGYKRDILGGIGALGGIVKHHAGFFDGSFSGAVLNPGQGGIVRKRKIEEFKKGMGRVCSKEALVFQIIRIR